MVRNRILVISLLLVGGYAWAADNVSNTAASAPAVSASTPVSDNAEENNEDKVLTPKYPIEIQSNNAEIKAMLTEHLPILYYQRKEVLDREQVEFLAEDTPTDALNMIKTEGYFNAKVTVTPKGDGYVVKVQTGPRTVIDNVNVALTGDILQDSALGAYYKNAFSDWHLPVGSPFRQEDWSSSKTSILTAVTRRKYPLAAFTQTQALINPNTQKADLTVNVDSKQPVFFGDFQISGNQRYPKNVILGLASFQAGDAYDLDKLLDYQQALESDSHYSGASVQADFDQLNNDRVPVKVAVSEMKRQKFEAGLDFDSEYGLGGNLGYEHYNLFNRGYVGSTSFKMDKYQTSFGLGISQPRDNRGHYYTSNIAYDRSTTQKLETRALSSGIWRVRDRGGIESRYGIEFVAEDDKIPDSGVNLGRSYATMLTASWKRQSIETPMRPKNGYYLDGKIGATLGKLLSSSTMVRFKGRAGWYFTPEDQSLGTFVARGELGYVYSKDDYATGNVPSSLMFRAGGANSVRGYELDSIGLKSPYYRKTVLPDRAMFSASAEYQFPIKKDFTFAVFHDVGSVAHTFKEMTLRHGTGVGVRWFSPVAPFAFDIAYGHHDKRFRWHISLGTRF